MAKCLECTHWKPCFNGKEWDAAIGVPCEYFATDNNVGGKTNADRIRTMSDEELGRFCVALICDPVPQNPVDYHQWFMEWLKQPVRDGE